jgi:AraC family transcriptional regulator
MQPRIETTAQKKIIGKRVTMTFAGNNTRELWKSFMPRRQEIKNHLTNDFISMQVYDQSFDFKNFDLYKKFEKWAAIEVSNFEIIPEGFDSYEIPAGLYAVFSYKGLSTDTEIFQYIFGTWLPGSKFALDSRPHFEILGEKYKNDDPSSEEEIWIPIKPK